MKKLVPILYTASILLGSFCPMSMASAMQPFQPMERISQAQEAVMSPYIPMTFVAPMSVAPVMVRHVESSPIAMAPGGCPGGSCVMTDHWLKQEIAMSAAAGDVYGGAAFPAMMRSVADSLSSKTWTPPLTSGSHFANTITTIVLIV
ncbi:hypothetical protein HY285_04125 [Candidatus Peregrinibacteria bacterium]|nr:hypothetical protein [Candidatus Peregrinibacteria bacterium]MBI3816700.1 hypothetical protein [Candidatus Peregrinibacteria bacterium]